MTVTTTKLLELIHDQVLAARNVENYFSSPIVQEIYESLSADTQHVILSCIYRNDFDDLKHILRLAVDKELAEHSIRKLKEIAKEHEVRNWSRLSKAELIVAIEEQISAQRVQTTGEKQDG